MTFARLGFLVFGMAVIWLAAALRPVWSSAACRLHRAFGVFMTAVAAFLRRSWMEGLPFDPIEDWLHSFAATAMGFAFAFGVLLRLVQRSRHKDSGPALDVVALPASIAIPLATAALPDFDGLLQRAIFFVCLLLVYK